MIYVFNFRIHKHASNNKTSPPSMFVHAFFFLFYAVSFQFSPIRSQIRCRKPINGKLKLYLHKSLIRITSFVGLN